MTLPDFLKFEPFNRLRRLMNAPLPAKFASGYVINHLTHDDLDRALEDIEGVTVDEVVSVTGWQRHTVRGVFSGTLKKNLGLTLASAQEERGRVYRIVEPGA